ncbi:MAG: YeeE/YedE thiosulfate transporter family protein [Candidatus Eisenbacteria bacterium]
MEQPRPFWNPYVAGVVLGLVLLASFLVMGFGLGSSGTFNRIGIGIVHAIVPGAVEGNGYFESYVQAGTPILDDWLVFLVLGVFLGGAFGAYTGGRLRGEVIRAKGFPAGRRIALALLGGALMGFAARFSRGCTSGQALSGGSLSPSAHGSS